VSQSEVNERETFTHYVTMDTDSLSRELWNKRYIFSDLLKVETIQQLQFSLDFRYFFCDKQKFNYYLMSRQKKNSSVQIFLTGRIQIW
jgi:hypothetical protein